MGSCSSSEVPRLEANSLPQSVSWKVPLFINFFLFADWEHTQAGGETHRNPCSAPQAPCTCSQAGRHGPAAVVRSVVSDHVSFLDEKLGSSGVVWPSSTPEVWSTVSLGGPSRCGLEDVVLQVFMFFHGIPSQNKTQNTHDILPLPSWAAHPGIIRWWLLTLNKIKWQKLTNFSSGTKIV